MSTASVAVQPRDHYVYWASDADGTLLYVGCTSRPDARHARHMAGQEGDGLGWFDQFVTSWRFRGPFPKDAAYALEAEELAVRQPVFNVRGVPGRRNRVADGVVAAYFHAHGLTYPNYAGEVSTVRDVNGF